MLPANPQPPCLANEFVLPDKALLTPEEDKLWYNGDFGKHFLGESNAGA